MISPAFSHKEQVPAAVSTELEHIFSQVKAELSSTIDEPVYRIWLEPLTAVDLTGNNLTVEAPAQTCGWVRERFGRVLQACAAAVLGPDLTVDIVASGSSRLPYRKPARPPPAQPRPQLPHSPTSPSAAIPSSRSTSS